MMKQINLVLYLGVVALCGLGYRGAFAGQVCEEREISAGKLVQAANRAYQLYQTLQALQADVAIVGRVGSDISDYGLKYTHAGIALRNYLDKPWVFVHVLNDCGTQYSQIYDQGLINFLLDDLFAWDLLLLIPSPALQANMRQILLQPGSTGLHQSRYSMLAYPFSTVYQNSNGWVLDVIAAAQMPVKASHRKETQAFLARQHYRGDRIHLSPLKHLGIALFSANIEFDDHPEENSLQGIYETVSVRSIQRYLQRTDKTTVREVK